MDKNQIVKNNKSSFSYGSFTYQLLMAWEKGTEKEKTDLEDKFPNLFKDCETRWRFYKDMDMVADGYYWHQDEILVCYNSSWKFANSNHTFDFLNKVASESHPFYGPIKPEPYAPVVRADQDGVPLPLGI